MEQQISLLVDRHVYPVGISAPGYWNQDLQYQEDGLAISDTVILRKIRRLNAFLSKPNGRINHL